MHPGTAEDLRTNFGATSLVAVAQAIAASLRDHARRGTPDATMLQEDRSRSRTRSTTVVDAFDARAEDGIDIDVVEARPTLVHALSELAKSAPVVDRSGGVGAARDVAHPIGFRRRRACARRGACAGARERRRARTSGAPDDVVFTAMGDAPEAVSRLVRGGHHVDGDDGRASRVAASRARRGARRRFCSTHTCAPPSSRPRRRCSCSTRNRGSTSEPARGGAGARSHRRSVGGVRPRSLGAVRRCLVRRRCFGRDDERAKLTRLIIEPSANDAPVLVSLHGRRGHGKTSLVRAARREAGLDDARAPCLWVPPRHKRRRRTRRPRRCCARSRARPPVTRTRRRASAACSTASPAVAARSRRRRAVVVAPVIPRPARRRRADVDSTARHDHAGDERSAAAIRVAVRRGCCWWRRRCWRRADDDGAAAVFVVPGAEAIDGRPRRRSRSREAVSVTSARVAVVVDPLEAAPAFESTFRVERIEVAGLPARARELCGVLLDRPGDDDESRCARRES